MSIQGVSGFSANAAAAPSAIAPVPQASVADILNAGNDRNATIVNTPGNPQAATANVLDPQFWNTPQGQALLAAQNRGTGNATSPPEGEKNAWSSFLSWLGLGSDEPKATEPNTAQAATENSSGQAAPEFFGMNAAMAGMSTGSQQTVTMGTDIEQTMALSSGAVHDAIQVTRAPGKGVNYHA